MEQEFRSRFAVERDQLRLRTGYEQGIGLRACGGMVADHHHGIEDLVEFLHHAERMAGPGADQAELPGSMEVMRLRPSCGRPSPRFR